LTIVEKNTNNYKFVWGPNYSNKNINKGDKDSLGAYFWIVRDIKPHFCIILMELLLDEVSLFISVYV